MLLDSAANCVGLVFIAPADENCELLATQPAQDIRLTEAFFQNIGDFDESAISGFVSVTIVDFFQAVEVNKGDGEGSRISQSELHTMLCKSQETLAVVQSGQVVDLRNVLQDRVGCGEFLRFESKFL